jgi:lipopolysaccharide/colanic/teichoic acid biosynthesis glycosyltransferase
VEVYTERQKQRLTIKPGITCYWQVLPQRNSFPFEEWLELDLKYIRERSVKADLKIMLQTVLAIFRMQGE